MLESRDKAKKDKNELQRYAIKILLNSFFGVLANPNCRFFSLDIANAITHFGQKMLEQNPIYQAREIQRITGIQTIAARDGMTINPNTYSVSLKHRNLNLY
mgnify:CR=1 FL=1